MSTTGEGLGCGLEEADASLALWEMLQADASGTYYYVGQRFLMSSLPFEVPACEYRTLIVVENGAVTRREMEDGLQSGDTPCASGWVEQAGELGSHDSSAENGLPAPVWTLDEVYASCCALLSDLSPELAGRFFADEQGLLERCFIQADPCGDCTSIAPAEWGDEIRIVHVGLGRPPD